MRHEKRQNDRYRKRLSLRYGVDELSKIGFTEDVSDTGIFIRTAAPLAPNLIITVLLKVSETETVQLKGRIMWAKRVPQNMMQRIKGGMGIRITEFIAGEETYRQLCTKRIRR